MKIVPNREARKLSQLTDVDLLNPVFFPMHAYCVLYSTVVHQVTTTFQLCHIKSINSPPSPTVSSPSRSIPQKAPVPNNHHVTRGIKIGLETLTSAAAMVVSSAFVSYAGATSTISAETICRPSKPRKMVRNSRV